jgi:ferrochelatase
MPNSKQAILLLNAGSPDSPKTKHVRRYLRQFLNNPRVINIPAIPRQILVNLIIAPLRAPKSAKRYKQIWTKEGFPLAYHAMSIKQKLQDAYKDTADIYTGMSFGNPSIKNMLAIIKQNNYEHLTVLPLFPQYASSSTGVVIEELAGIIKKWTVIPQIRIINHFYNHPLFIKAFAERIKKYGFKDYDHILFSYHGLPESHIWQMCGNKNICEYNCEQAPSGQNILCYKAACYQTTRLIARALNLNNQDYTTAFQSRMGKNWIQPFTDKLIVAKARQGVKKLLAIAPSFVADCLETTIELGFECKKLFQESGGRELTLVESLNDSEEWIAALKGIIEGR